MKRTVTFHRVLHPKHVAIKPEHRVSTRDAKVKDGFCYWPLDRALQVACLFPSATVDQTGLYEKDFKS